MNGDTPAEASAVRALPIREIRDELRKRGVDLAGCLEKDDLVALLLANWHTAPSHEEAPSPHAAAPTSSSSGGGRSPLPSAAGSSDRPPPTAGGSGNSQDGGTRGSRPSRTKSTESVGYYKCEHCSKKGEKMSHCSKCGTGNYCSKECQAARWPDHKKVCKQRMEAKQRQTQKADDTLGTGMVTAFTAWATRNRHWLTHLAAATLPAPPRNDSHVLYLELHCCKSSPDGEAKPRFALQGHYVITLERLYEMTAPAGGPGPLPAGPPDRMLVFMVCTSSSLEAVPSPGAKKVALMTLMRSVGLDPSLQSDLEGGRMKLTPLDSLFAVLSQLS